MHDQRLIDLMLACDGTAEVPADRREQLLADLQANDRFRQELAERMSMAGLVRVVQAPEPRWLRLEDHLELASDPQPTVEERVMHVVLQTPPRRSATTRTDSVKCPGRFLPTLVAAACLFMAGLWLFAATRYAGSGDSSVDATQGERVGTTFATISRVCYPLVGPGEEPLFVGKKLGATRVRLLGGGAEFTLSNGVNIVLEGPADLQLIDEMQARLDDGSAVVRMPKGLNGFRLRTASTDILDLGTEFAARVMPDLATDVQVYDGAVVATPSNGMPVKRLPQRLEVGQAARFSVAGETAVELIPFLEDRFARQFADTGNGVEETVGPDRRRDNRDLRRLFGTPRHDGIAVTPRQSRVAIDAVLEEWPATPGFTTSLPDGDERVAGWMMYDADQLYLAAEVRDPSPLRNVFDPRFDAFAAWRGGGLQIRISTDRKQRWPVVANGPVYYADKPGLAASPEATAAAENPKLSHLTLWYHAPTQTPCLAIARGMYVDRLDVNPDGFTGCYRLHEDGLGYTVEYAISWDLLHAATDPPQAGDVLATAWQVHFSGRSGRIWRDQLVEIRNRLVPTRRYVWGQAETWGQAIFQ